MKVAAGSITAIAKRGRTSLMVPDICIGHAEFEECPDTWFERLHYGKYGLRKAVGREQGFLYLTREGYEANKDALIAAYVSACGVPERFTADVEAHFANVRASMQKEIESAQHRLDLLRQAFEETA